MYRSLYLLKYKYDLTLASLSISTSVESLFSPNLYLTSQGIQAAPPHLRRVGTFHVWLCDVRDAPLEDLFDSSHEEYIWMRTRD